MQKELMDRSIRLLIEQKSLFQMTLIGVITLQKTLDLKWYKTVPQLYFLDGAELNSSQFTTNFAFG